MKDEDVKYIKDIIQSANINFLIGSGLSRPFLSTLGNIEKYLTEIYENTVIDKEVKLLVEASLINLYFKDVIYKNICVIGDCTSTDKIKTSKNYSDFLTIINSLLQRRGSTILNKKVNIFTTNIDLFLETTIEKLGLEFNDGFSGRFSPTFSLSNYNKLLSKKSLYFENESKIPVFNLLKIHGSLNWKYRDNTITYLTDLKVLEDLKILSEVCDFISVEETDTIDSLIKKAEFSLILDDIKETEINQFKDLYNTLPIVNPTKAKFKETVLDLNYYELLRFYSNELEKENSVLFVMGFSMADEHIAEMTLRLAKSNPTLTIIIFALHEAAKDEIERNLNNTTSGNIKIFYPIVSSTQYSFESINSLIFQPILDKTNKNE